MTIEEFIQECKKEFDPAKYELDPIPRLDTGAIRIVENKTGCVFCPLTFLSYAKHGKFNALADPECAAEDLSMDSDTGEAIVQLADNEPAEYAEYGRKDFDDLRAELIAAFSVEAK